jgi:hypothetical protein
MNRPLTSPDRTSPFWIVSFFTAAPGRRSSLASDTQKVLGRVAASQASTAEGNDASTAATSRNGTAGNHQPAIADIEDAGAWSSRISTGITRIT